MAKYQKYAEYKDSGVEWVDDIPSTWEVKPVFALFTPEMEKNLDGIETNVLSLSYGRIIQRDVENNHGLLPESFNTYQIVNDGDIILRLTDLQNDKRSLRVGLATQKGIITSAYLKLSALKEIDPKFAYRLLHSYDTTKVFYGMGGGLRQSMKFEDFRRLPILVPPKSEQTQIANFLDHETAQIDSLIAKQEKLIELLKEKRQAVISHAVTKGLNPDVTMKDSGVEWLGQVPEHWVTLPLKLCIKTRKGVAFKAVDFCDFGIRVVKASDIKQKTIRESDVFLPEKYLTEYPKAILKEGELVLSTVGSTPDVKNSAVGQIGKVPKELNNSLLNQNTVVYSAKKNLDQNFLFYVVQADSYRDHLDLHAHGTANQASLNIENMLDFKISIPDLNEQKEITSYLDKKMSEYEKLELHSLSIINLLIERRTALISSAVTGKIDVRNWQHSNEANMGVSS